MTLVKMGICGDAARNNKGSTYQKENRPMKKQILISVLSAALFLSTLGQGGDEIAVIVNKDSSVQSLTEAQLRALFQTTKTSFAGGRALPLNLPRGNSARTGFDAAVLGLDPDRVARYWVDRKIRGGNPPPKKLAKPELVVKVVAAKNGAIGYVNSSVNTERVKVVAYVRGGQVLAP